MSKEIENMKPTSSDQIQKSYNNLTYQFGKTLPSSSETKSNPVNNVNSDDEILMSDFLDFLRTACQIHDIIFFGESKFFGEPNLNDISNNNKMINKIFGDTIKQRISELSSIYDNQLGSNTTTSFSNNNSNIGGQSNRLETTSSLLRKRSMPGIAGLNLKNSINKTKLETQLAVDAHTTKSGATGYGKGIHPNLKKKLDEFIDEGIIDSILPHICPAHYPIAPTTILQHYNSVNTATTACNGNNIPNGHLFQNSSNLNCGNNNVINSNNCSSNGNLSTSTSKNGLKMTSKVKDSHNVSNCNGSNGKIGQRNAHHHHHASVDILDSELKKDNGGESVTTTAKSNESIEKLRTPKTADTVYKVKENKTTLRRKSLASGLGSRDSNENKKLGESEVVIHVCDEVKSTSKDFSCPQNLLVTKMKYFADVTGGQKLEDMDISVHCDIQIFEWLMRWVKRDIDQSSDGSTNAPQLDATNVIPILVSASFLQMEPLLLDCLSFCHARLNDVVRTSTNLSCLNDGIITRLAAMFTNIELEMVKDKKERVTPRLWSKLIQSLMEPEPQALRGHYFSLAGLFKCQKCGKYLTQSAATYINCASSNVRINRWGQLVSQHVKDTQWDINHYISTLHKELKSWRKVYWKLWGHCHFLYCCICETHFPVYQMNWCLFHPEAAQFLGPISEGHAPGPAGRYPCCGQQAFRFETLIGPNGCQFREHSVLIETDRDRAVLALAQIAAEGGCLTETPKVKINTQFGASYEPIWIGISLMPTKCRQGLLPVIHLEEPNTKLPRRGKPPITYPESSSESESSDSIPTAKGKFSSNQISGSTDGCESESSSERNYRNNRRRRGGRGLKTYGRYWCGEVSARSNQDNQREFEEKVIKQIMTVITKKNGNESSHSNINLLNGGSYVRLESEWKEQLRQKNCNKLKGKF